MPLMQLARLIPATTLLCFAALLPRIADATIVTFETVLGSFEVNLYDNATPRTVENFLNYVQNGSYSDSIFHRSVSGFIVQGGGFVTDVNAQISDIPANASVINEPVFSNVRATIAMAKLGSDPNSATNQWFFNLANNAANLDNQNGGFTVFGEVTGNGMAVINALAALPTYDFGGALTSLPLQNYNTGDAVDNTHLIIVTAITVTDSTVNSAAGLNPTPTTAGNSTGSTGGGGGGSLGLLALLGLAAFGALRIRRL